MGLSPTCHCPRVNIRVLYTSYSCCRLAYWLHKQTGMLGNSMYWVDGLGAFYRTCAAGMAGTPMAVPVFEAGITFSLCIAGVQGYDETSLGFYSRLWAQVRGPRMQEHSQGRGLPPCGAQQHTHTFMVPTGTHKLLAGTSHIPSLIYTSGLIVSVCARAYNKSDHLWHR